MASSSGQRQEQQLFRYLRIDRRCVEVIEGDQQVRNFLGMKGMFKCADALGLRQRLNAAGPRRVTVAESKGTDMNSAVEQLGNAAVGVFEKFGRETAVDLLLIVPAVQHRPSGALSPGPGYHAVPLKTGLQKFTLQEAMGGQPLPVHPRVTYPEGLKWASQVASLRIVLLALDGPNS